MPDPTQLNQADEALRQVLTTEPAASTSALLTRIADRLTDNLPGKPMREVNRLAYALAYADHEHGYRSTMSVAVERALLRQMPRVDDRTITRGEYALLLRAASTKADRVAELHRQAAADYAHAQDPVQQAAARTQLALARSHVVQALR